MNLLFSPKIPGPTEPVPLHDRPPGPQRAALLQAPLRECRGAHAHRVHPHRGSRMSEVWLCIQGWGLD